MQDPKYVEKHIPSRDAFCPEKLRRVIMQCCQMNPEKRPNGEEIVKILRSVRIARSVMFSQFERHHRFSC